MQTARRARIDTQPTLDITTLVFVDETGASTNMTRARGRAPQGERCIAAVPHGHWKTTTFVAGLRYDDITAPMVLDGPMDGPAFLAYVQHCLGPTLKPGDLVIADNLSCHKVAGVQEAIEARGATRRHAALSAALLPGSEPHREDVRQTQSAAAQGGQTHGRFALG